MVCIGVPTAIAAEVADKGNHAEDTARGDYEFDTSYIPCID